MAAHTQYKDNPNIETNEHSFKMDPDEFLATYLMSRSSEYKEINEDFFSDTHIHWIGIWSAQFVAARQAIYDYWMAAIQKVDFTRCDLDQFLRDSTVPKRELL